MKFEEEDNSLTRSEAIDLMSNNPYLAIRHRLFDEDEYIYFDGQVIRDENNNVFEDFGDSIDHNGLRIRKGGSWETGWESKPHIMIKKQERR